MQLLALDINWNLYLSSDTGVGVIMLVYYSTIIKCFYLCLVPGNGINCKNSVVYDIIAKVSTDIHIYIVTYFINLT